MCVERDYLHIDAVSTVLSVPLSPQVAAHIPLVIECIATENRSDARRFSGLCTYVWWDHRMGISRRNLFVVFKGGISSVCDDTTDVLIGRA